MCGKMGCILEECEVLYAPLLPILSAELTDLLVKCDMPLSFYAHLGCLGVKTIAKLAYSVSTDKELLDEIMATTSVWLCQLPNFSLCDQFYLEAQVG